MKGGNYKDPGQDSGQSYVQLPAYVELLANNVVTVCTELNSVNSLSLSLPPSLSRRMVGEYNVLSANYKTSKFTAYPRCKNL